MKTLLISLILLLFAGCATNPHRSTSDRAQRAEALFDQLDTNHDGALSRAELSAGLRYAGTPDLNPNLVMGLKTGSVKKVKASRKLTDSEIKKVMNEAFDSRDAKLDQRLSKDEFKKLVVERPPNESDDPWQPFM